MGAVKIERESKAHLFATPPLKWWEKKVCSIIGAKTFHWGWLVHYLDEDNDFITSESIRKGTAISRLGNRHAYLYRIKELGKVDPLEIVSIHSRYGGWGYDWQVGFRTAIWWILKHYFGEIVPIVRDDAVNCQEWVCLLAEELGVRLIPNDAYPMCINLESSPHLEFVGIT